MIDYRSPEIMKARSKAFALLLQWAKETEQKPAQEVDEVCYTGAVTASTGKVAAETNPPHQGQADTGG